MLYSRFLFIHVITVLIFVIKTHYTVLSQEVEGNINKCATYLYDYKKKIIINSVQNSRVLNESEKKKIINEILNGAPPCDTIDRPSWLPYNYAPLQINF